ncbi:hypothetical protein [Bacteroides pyogenes]|nr:hypothetical protein [Bacteroides pyogenes]
MQTDGISASRLKSGHAYADMSSEHPAMKSEEIRSPDNAYADMPE